MINTSAPPDGRLAETVEHGVINGENQTEMIAASDLMLADRFDLGAKVLYARTVLQKSGEDWGREVYREHLRAFNGFIELMNPSKSSFNDFNQSFLDLIHSIDSGGFDRRHGAVPVDASDLIKDGAHRVAACAVTGHSIFAQRTDGDATHYGWRYFNARGLSLAVMESMACEFLRYRDDIHVVMLYPAAQANMEAAFRIVEDDVSVLYRKQLNLSAKGAHNLIWQVYEDESWVGRIRDGFAGAYRKQAGCFPDGGGELTAVLVQVSDMNKLLEVKARVRECCGVANHSIHTSDTREDTQRLCQILFNPNSEWALNSVHLEPLSASFCNFVKSFDNQDHSDVCLGPSALTRLIGIDNNSEAVWLRDEKICTDPRKHFYFRTIKVIAPQEALNHDLLPSEMHKKLLEFMTTEIGSKRRRGILRFALARSVHCFFRLRRFFLVDATYRRYILLRNRWRVLLSSSP